MASEKNNSKNLIITIIVIVVVASSAFYGGMMYQKSQVASRAAQFTQGAEVAGGRFGSRAGGARGGRGGFGGAVMGDVLSVDADSITVKLMDGSSKIVNLASTTTYSKSLTGSKTDLAAGIKVAVFGTSNSDGSVTAQNVSINPMIRFGGLRPTGTQ